MNEIPEHLQRELEVLQELRAVVREAHEAIRDLNSAMKSARELRDEFINSDAILEKLGTLVKDGLDEYDETLQQAIKVAEKAMYNRFDVLTAICLGEDPESVKTGVTSVPQLLREYIASQGLPYRLVKRTGAK
jgi:hypothetical protein